MDVEVEQGDATKNFVVDSECNDTQRFDNEHDGSTANSIESQANGDCMETVIQKTVDDIDTQPSNDVNCLVQLIFKDATTFEELHSLIGKCVRDALFDLKKPVNVTVDRTKNSIQIVEIETNENDGNIFMVDTLPTDNTIEAEIPDYNSSIIDVLNNEENDIKDGDGENGSKSKGGNCWNCGGDHTMKDCKEKRDPAAISRAKAQFMQKTRVERYHLDNEQKYSHLVPGKISSSLREALGLRSRELPLYIYKMRLYGYPDGWLEEAKINHSGLSLINSQNKRSIDQDIEDGEVDRVTFDATKFIEYPGFNAVVPSNLIDEGEYYRVPPMQFSNTKEGLTQLLQDNLAKKYKRKRLKLDDAFEPSTENSKEEDMDIQESDCGSDTNETPVIFPQVRPLASTDESNSTSIADEVLQASLLELKQKQEEILKALEDEASSDSNITSLDQNDIPTNQTDSEQKTNSETDSNVEKNIDNTTLDSTLSESINELAESTNQSESVQNTPSVSATGHSRMAMFGTPLMKQVSPYSKLPDGEKWSVGVTDVIDFENLPDATGAYQKLTGVISKVRSVIKRINDDTEHDSS